MTNTKATNALKIACHGYYRDKAPQTVYYTDIIRRIFKDNCENKFHGGYDSTYPYIDSATDSAYWYSPGTDGTAATQSTAKAPADTDFLAGMHQEGWTFFFIKRDLNQAEKAMNVGGWANEERVISLAKQKMDSLMMQLGNYFTKNIVLGTGANYTYYGGLAALMNTSNSNYGGLDFSGADSARAPQTLTIASAGVLDEDHLYTMYGLMEDENRHPQIILMPQSIKNRLRMMSALTVERAQGGNVTFGHDKFNTLQAKMVTSKYMPTNRIYWLNFDADPDLDLIKGKRQVEEGAYWIWEFAGPAPMGYSFFDWQAWGPAWPDMDCTWVTGGSKIMCIMPEYQGYTVITA